MESDTQVGSPEATAGLTEEDMASLQALAESHVPEPREEEV